MAGLTTPSPEGGGRGEAAPAAEAARTLEKTQSMKERLAALNKQTEGPTELEKKEAEQKIWKDKQVRKGHQIEETPLDVSGIKGKWKSGTVADESKKQESRYGEEAMFRCNTAIMRTGGVHKISQAFRPAHERVQYEDDPTNHFGSKVDPKIQELADQIDFNPNTMLPNAQHPGLNYSAMEMAKQHNDWRDFKSGGLAGLPRDNVDDDDEPLPPPPSKP